MNKIEYVLHELNFGSHCKPIHIRKQSDQSKSLKNQLHKCEPKKWKGFRVSKIGNVEVVRVRIFAFVCRHSFNVDIFLRIV